MERRELFVLKYSQPPTTVLMLATFRLLTRQPWLCRGLPFVAEVEKNGGRRTEAQATRIGSASHPQAPDDLNCFSNLHHSELICFFPQITGRAHVATVSVLHSTRSCCVYRCNVAGISILPASEWLTCITKMTSNAIRSIRRKKSSLSEVKIAVIGAPGVGKSGKLFSSYLHNLPLKCSHTQH